MVKPIRLLCSVLTERLKDAPYKIRRVFIAVRMRQGCIVKYHCPLPYQLNAIVACALFASLLPSADIAVRPDIMYNAHLCSRVVVSFWLSS